MNVKNTANNQKKPRFLKPRFFNDKHKEILTLYKDQDILELVEYNENTPLCIDFSKPFFIKEKTPFIFIHTIF